MALAALLVVVPVPESEAAELTAVVDFDSGLSAGDVPSALSAGVGISGQDLGTVSVTGSSPRIAGNAAMVFDSSCGGQSVAITDPSWERSQCSGEDWDLYIPGQGNSLIITEDGDATDPDDSATGGTFAFDFSSWGAGAVTFKSLTVIDLEGPAGSAEIHFFDPGGSLIARVPIVSTGGDNTIAKTTADISGVGSAVVVLDNSGAIDDFVIATEVPIIDLELTKTVDDKTVMVGDQVTFMIEATNQGADGATGVEIVDSLPAAMTYVSHVISTGAFDAGTLTWNVGAIADGETVTLAITARADQEGTFVNQAEVVAANESDSDSTPNDGFGDDWDDVVVVVTPGPVDPPAVSIVKSPDLQSVSEGSAAVFEITVANEGGVDLVDVVVSDPLAPGCDLVIGDLAVGESVSYECSLAGVDAGFTNVAMVTAASASGVVVTDDDDALVEVTESPVCDLGTVISERPIEGKPLIERTGEPLITAAGDEFDYIVAVRNSGCSEPVTGVVVEVILDRQLELSTGNDGCSSDDGLVVCGIGTVAANDIETIAFRVRVRPDPPTIDALRSRVQIDYPKIGLESDKTNNEEQELTPAFGVAVKADVVTGDDDELPATGIGVALLSSAGLVSLAMGALLLAAAQTVTRRRSESAEPWSSNP